jgi:predicted alpha/beta hydrolase family esterase
MPDYNVWKEIFEWFPVDENTTLIAHSCGCGFLLKWLSQNDVRFKKLILVAPWLDPKKTRNDFLTCRLKGDLESRIEEIHVFYSLDEPVDGVKETVELVRKSYPSAKYHEFQQHGHFDIEAMGTDAFPELLAAAVSE